MIWAICSCNYPIHLSILSNKVLRSEFQVNVGTKICTIL